MTVEVKICGLTTPEALRAAVVGGARYVGFVFFPPSPRNIAFEAAAELAAGVPTGVRKVGLVVDAEDALIADLLARVPLDLLQLHGRETPERIFEVRQRFALPVIKAVGIAGPADLARAEACGEAADILLLDAKPPPGASRPGGNALAFDWTLIANRRWLRPWLLAGGLTPENVAEALRVTSAPGVDVSSGVEDAPGRKNPARIRAFLEAAGAG